MIGVKPALWATFRFHWYGSVWGSGSQTGGNKWLSGG